MPTWLFSSCSTQCTSAWMHRSGYRWVWVIDRLWLWHFGTERSWTLIRDFLELLFWKLECLQPLQIEVSPISAYAWRHKFGCFSRFRGVPSLSSSRRLLLELRSGGNVTRILLLQDQQSNSGCSGLGTAIPGGICESGVWEDEAASPILKYLKSINKGSLGGRWFLLGTLKQKDGFWWKVWVPRDVQWPGARTFRARGCWDRKQDVSLIFQPFSRGAIWESGGHFSDCRFGDEPFQERSVAGVHGLSHVLRSFVLFLITDTNTQVDQVELEFIFLFSSFLNQLEARIFHIFLFLLVSWSPVSSVCFFFVWWHFSKSRQGPKTSPCSDSARSKWGRSPGACYSWLGWIEPRCSDADWLQVVLDLLGWE